MAGRMISELNNASVLLPNDLFPLARGSTTLKLDGQTLINNLSSTLLDDLSSTLTTVISASNLVGARGGGTNKIFWENDQIVTDSYTITTGKNAMTAGPVKIIDGVTVTIPVSSIWKVL